MSTTFTTPADFPPTTLSLNYTAGSNSLSLAVGQGAALAAALTTQGLPAISSAAPLRFLMRPAASYVAQTGQFASRPAYTVYSATGLSGDVLSGLSVLEGTTDQNFYPGDIFIIEDTGAATYAQNAAINAIESGTTTTNASKLQGTAVSASTPSTNNGLVYSGGAWTPISVVIQPGIAGGQTVYGDTAASGNLTLSSTFNATKGNVQITDGSKLWVASAAQVGSFGPRFFTVQDTSTAAQIRSTTTGAHGIAEFYAAGLTTTNAIWSLNWLANDTGGTVHTYAAIGPVATDLGTSTSTANLRFRVIGNGALSTYQAELEGATGNWSPSGNGTQSLGDSTHRWNASVGTIDASGPYTGFQDKGGQLFNVKAYGALANSKTVTDGAMSSVTNPTQLTSATANFTAADQGKSIAIVGAGAGGATLINTIATVVNATTITIGGTCLTTVSGAAVQYGHDDTTAIQAAINAASAAGGGAVFFPNGQYFTTAALTVPSLVELRGAGENTIIQPSLGFSGGGAHAIVELIGSSGIIQDVVIRDLVLDSQATLRLSANALAYQVILSNAQYVKVERVVFRNHGYIAISPNYPSDPCLLIIAKDTVNDLANTIVSAATDLVVDAVTNTKVTSLTHSFTVGDVGDYVNVTGGAGWTVGNYKVLSTSGGAATLDSSPAAVGTTGGNYNLYQPVYPSAVVGPSLGHHIFKCRFEGSGTSQFAIRELTDWNLRRTQVSGFTNLVAGTVVDSCSFVPYAGAVYFGFNVIEHAGGGTTGNSVVNCWFPGSAANPQGTLTCIDFDKGCSQNAAIGNHIGYCTKASYYIGDNTKGLAIIDDHGIPASDPSGAYYSDANRIIGNTIGTIDSPTTTDINECAIGIQASTRSYIAGNVITSVNPTLANGNGIKFSECSQATIEGNAIQNVSNGIKSDSTATSRYGMRIIGNDIQCSGGCAITFGGGTAASGNLSYGVVIANNSCNAVQTSTGVIYLGGEVTAPLVSGNTVIGGNSGILSQTTGTTLVGNVSKDASAVAFRVYFDATLNGNRHLNSGGLLFSGTISSSTKLVLSGNYWLVPVVTKTSTYTMALTDMTVEASATTAGFTITLPDPRLLPDQTRRVVRIDNTPANAVSFATPSGSINNNATLTAQWSQGIFYSDGANWFKQ